MGSGGGLNQTFRCKSYADCPIFLGHVMYNMISSVIPGVIGHSGGWSGGGSQAGLTVSGSHRPLWGVGSGGGQSNFSMQILC